MIECQIAFISEKYFHPSRSLLHSVFSHKKMSRVNDGHNVLCLLTPSWGAWQKSGGREESSGNLALGFILVELPFCQGGELYHLFILVLRIIPFPCPFKPTTVTALLLLALGSYISGRPIHMQPRTFVLNMWPWPSLIHKLHISTIFPTDLTFMYCKGLKQVCGLFHLLCCWSKRSDSSITGSHWFVPNEWT